jgi:hypothetical protein
LVGLINPIDKYSSKNSQTAESSDCEWIDWTQWRMGALVDIDLKIVRPVRGKFVSFLLTENIRKVMIFFRNTLKISNRLRCWS